MSIYKCFLLFIFSVVLPFASSSAQEIDFGSFSNASVSITELSATSLDFGFVISGEGVKSISLADSKVLAVTGVRFLDVILTVDADQELLLDGNISCQGDPDCSIPFTLEAAYANRGINDIGQAQFLTVSANSATAQFPILRRLSGPPAPPPTPPNGNFNPAQFEETTYLYLYGSINTGEVNAGTYTGQITVSIIYD